MQNQLDARDVEIVITGAQSTRRLPVKEVNKIRFSVDAVMTDENVECSMVREERIYFFDTSRDGRRIF